MGTPIMSGVWMPTRSSNRAGVSVSFSVPMLVMVALLVFLQHSLSRLSLVESVEDFLPIYLYDNSDSEFVNSSRALLRIYQEWDVQNETDEDIWTLVNYTHVHPALLGDNVKPKAYSPASYPGYFLYYFVHWWQYPELYYEFTINVTPKDGLHYGFAPDRGLLDRGGGPVFFTFECQKRGRYVVNWLAKINQWVSQMNFVKYCEDATCEGKCGTRGACRNLTSNICDCDYGYSSQANCRVGLNVDRNQSEVCAGESFTVSWDVTLTDKGAREDYIQITPPDLVYHNASDYSWTMDDMRQYLRSASKPTRLPPSAPAGPKVKTWQWFFLGGNIRSYTPPVSIREYLTQGSYSFQFSGDEIPGAYGITFMRANDDGSGNSTLHAVTTVRLLPSTHERCIALNHEAIQQAAVTSGTGIPSCVHGTLVDTAGVNSCTCEEGFFGSLCQYGCAPRTELVGSVATAAAWDSQNVYSNDMSCEWSVSAPPAPTGSRVSAMLLQFADFATEFDRDIVTVWTRFNQSQQLHRSMSGVITALNKDLFVVVPGEGALIQFVTDENNPSWTNGSGQTGFSFTYRTVICPYGQYVSTDTGFCQECPLDYFNEQEFISSCALCPEGTFREGIENRCAPHHVDLTPGSQAAANAFIALAGVAILIQGLGMIVYRKNPIITNASIGCLTLLMLGSALMVISAITWSLVQTAGLCIIKYALLCVGLQLILGALFMRTYRIEKIFNNTNLKMINITMVRVVLTCMAFVALDVVLLVAWFASGSPRIESDDRKQCLIDNSQIFLPLLFISKLAIAGAIFLLSYRVRGIPASYNESRSQSTILYNMIVSLLVIGVLFAIFGTATYRQTYGRSSLVIIVATCWVVIITTFLSLGIKVITVIRGNISDKRAGSRGRSGTSKRNTESEMDVVARVVPGLQSHFSSIMEADNEDDDKGTAPSSVHEAESKHDSSATSTPNSSAPLDKDGVASDRPPRRDKKTRKKSRRMVMDDPALKQELLKSLTTNAKEIKALDVDIARWTKRTAATQREIDYISSLRAALVLDQQYNAYCQRRGHQPDTKKFNAGSSNSSFNIDVGSHALGNSAHSHGGMSPDTGAMIELNSSPAAASPPASPTTKS